MKEAVSVVHLFSYKEPPISLPSEPCPEDWLYFKRKCYYLSEEEKDWDSSQSFCSLYEASLAVIENHQEMCMSKLTGYRDEWICGKEIRSCKTRFSEMEVTFQYYILANLMSSFKYGGKRNPQKRIWECVGAGAGTCRCFWELIEHFLTKRMHMQDSWIGLRKREEGFYWVNGTPLTTDL
ncbi:C-type lectin domain family 2 member L [Chelonia mydas]|uniref:C-type lectin domain family 2 member L n=1 Tax=Chelonia mydas TaxID=8469 RepID=M7C9N8_CHEMY|nr:C-type lectin domain family 2 member L [Chelonia mydas]